MSDPQFAELTQGHGCQEPSCTDSRPRKIYWAMQMRFCTSCYKKRFCAYKEIEMNFLKYPGLRKCLIQHRWERGKRYKDISSFLDGRSVAFDRPAVQKLTEVFTKSGGKVDKDWYKEHVALIRTLTMSLETCEDFFKVVSHDGGKRRSEKRRALVNYLEGCALDMIPALDVFDLHDCPSFQKARARYQTGSHEAVWQRLLPKLQRERADVGRDDSSDTEFFAEQARGINKPEEELRICTSEDEPETDESVAEESPIDDNMAEEQPMTAPYAVVIPNRGTDHAASAGNVGFTPTAMNASDTGLEASEGYEIDDLASTMNVSHLDLGPSERNGDTSRPETGRVPWPATVAFPWYTSHTAAHPRHSDQ
ncbi:hypothetical protein MMC17_000388 [Xylographa soralifera]|nr:hypothetical protein [Xylographa soralifera]